MKKLMQILRRMFSAPPALVALANVAEGTHEDGKTYLADAAQTSRYLLVKQGTDATHVAACGASDDPLGIAEDEAAAAEDPMCVQPLGSTKRTQKMVGAEAIAVGARVFTAASGKVQDLPTAQATYYLVGRALTACGGDGQEFEVDACFPVATVVSG
jgi:hypothetical protein